jgi:hypothetical protein
MIIHGLKYLLLLFDLIVIAGIFDVYYLVIRIIYEMKTFEFDVSIVIHYLFSMPKLNNICTFSNKNNLFCNPI